MNQKVVLVRLKGGLGNQLFQWACAHEVVSRLDARLLIDPRPIRRLNSRSWLDNRDFELDYFGIRPQIFDFLRLRLSGNRLFEEADYVYDHRIESVTPPLIIQGYFQSWRYFRSQSDEIRRYLRAHANQSSELRRIAGSLSSSRWIGVHVRRGDYLRTNQMAILGKEYYEPAIDLARAEVGDVPVVVFSDSPDLARLVVPRADLFIGSPELPTPGDNLMLMSRAHFLIGANSSMSWWAAFLRDQSLPNPVLPRTWFTNPSRSTKDLFLPGWTLV